VQKRAGNTMELIGTGNDSLNRTQIAQSLKERIDKKKKASAQKKK
jgi:hypothetical protein